MFLRLLLMDLKDFFEYPIPLFYNLTFIIQIIMSRKFLYSTLTVALFFSLNVVFGHGETQTKSNCSWEWKHKAIGTVTNGIRIPYSDQNACGNVVKTVSNPCAWRSSTINYGASNFDGAFYSTP